MESEEGGLKLKMVFKSRLAGLGVKKARVKKRYLKNIGYQQFE
jgi:hypothetical protein